MLRTSPPPLPDIVPLEQHLMEKLAQEFRLPLLQYFQRRIPHPDDAEDLVQETFMRLIKRGNITELTGIRSYLFETASSVVIDHVRRRRARHGDQHQSFDPAAHGGEDFSAEHVALGREAHTRAARALLELLPRTRAVFVLRRVEGMSYRQIAARLCISLSLVEKEMARALAHLTSRMERE